MADNYSVLSSTASVELLGLDDFQDVQETMVVAHPSGVTFPVRVAASGDLAAATGERASALADLFNAAHATDGVAAIAVTQDVDMLGNLIDVVIIAVVSSNGRIASERTLPLSEFLGGAGIGPAALGGLSFQVMPSGGGGGLEAFSSRVSGWRSDLDALANL